MWNWVVCMEIDDFSHYILIFNVKLSSEDQDLKPFCALQQLNYIELNQAVRSKLIEPSRTFKMLDSNQAGAWFKTSSIEPNRALTLKHQTESSRPLSLIRPIRADPSARIVWIDCHLWLAQPCVELIFKVFSFSRDNKVFRIPIFSKLFSISMAILSFFVNFKNSHSYCSNPSK